MPHAPSPPGHYAQRRPRLLLTIVLCAGLAVAGCSSDTSPTITSTTVAKAAAGAKTPVGFAAEPQGPIGPDSSQSQKCFALRAFRYLGAMPESGLFFKDKMAETPQIADQKVASLGAQLKLAIPELAADITTLIDTTHTRLQQVPPPSGIEALGSPADLKLTAYLEGNCPVDAAPA